MSWHEIQYVFVLMMENQSFDRILGWRGLEDRDVDGIQNAFSCPSGPPYFGAGEIIAPEARASFCPPGALHTPEPIFQQLHSEYGKNQGFVFEQIAYITRKAGLRQWGQARAKDSVIEVMRYYTPEQIPVTAQLARNFCVCDRWFSPIASSTFPNRYFLHFGTSPTGASHLPYFLPKRNIFSRLQDSGKSWRVYHDGLAPIHAMAPLWFAAARQPGEEVRDFHEFFRSDVAKGDVAAYTFIEPCHWPHGDRPGNSDHTGQHVHHGQRLIGTIYNILRSNPHIWRHTLYVVTYDEHGGYYDHVSPEPAPEPRSGERGKIPKKGSMGYYGARVPALIISPWIQPQTYKKTCDHTSVLAFLAKRFHFDSLTQRDAQADDLTALFGPDLRNDTPEELDLPSDPGRDACGPEEPDERHEELFALTGELLGEDPELAPDDMARMTTIVEDRLARITRGEFAEDIRDIIKGSGTQ